MDDDNHAALPHPGFYVFADKTTGAIRGWASVREPDLEQQELGPNEIVVKVDRQPNLAVDRYVNLATGEMRAHP